MKHFGFTEFGNVVLEGLNKAENEYLRWTNAWGLLDDGVEAFASVKIGEHILDESRRRWGQEYPYGGCVSLETRISRLKDDGYLQDVDSDILGGRIDIIYWDNKGSLCGIVEVKRWLDKSTYPKDIDRIGRIVSRNNKSNKSTLRYGCFVFIIQEQSKSTIKERIKKIQSMKDDFSQRAGCKCEIRHSEIKSWDDRKKIAGVVALFKA